jgi:hypothetical protein
MKILVLKSKHGNYYYKGDSPAELEESARKIMKLHLEIGFYDWSEPEGLRERVQKELDNPSGKAWGFIRGRSSAGHEYEHVSVETVE